MSNDPKNGDAEFGNLMASHSNTYSLVKFCLKKSIFYFIYKNKMCKDLIENKKLRNIDISYKIYIK